MALAKFRRTTLHSSLSCTRIARYQNIAIAARPSVRLLASRLPANAIELSQEELDELRRELATLRSENESLKQELAQLQLRAENEALKRQVARLRVSPPAPASAKVAAATPVTPPKAAAPSKPAAPPTPTAAAPRQASVAAPAAVSPATSPRQKTTPPTAATGDPSNVKSKLEAGILWPSAGEKFWEREPRVSPMPLVDPSAPKERIQLDQRLLQIVHVAAEMAPIAKVGGLGDVVTGLARACLERGHQVSVMLPFYECLPVKDIEGLKHERDIDVPKGKVWDGTMQLTTLRTSVYWGRVEGVPTYFIRPADWNAVNIFRGGRIYGGSYDEKEAYLYFCRACLEFLKVTAQQPHVLHVHEWQTCAIPLLYWEIYNPQGMWRPRVVLTIHNMDNTGEVKQDEFAQTGYPGESFATIDKALDERTIGHNPERLNLMKGGIVYSNAITTVSPTYAREMVEGGAAGWLRPLLSKPDFRAKLSGILNGIDTSAWDPATDPLLPANFNTELMDGKALCKRFLQRGLGLEEAPSKPLVAVISRLVPQKGIHLIRASIMRTIEQGGQFVLLGSGHSDPIFKALATKELKDHPNARLLIMYSEALSHTIYGGADIVVVPSLFEPCGLTQMIAMRYGAVPVVRRTGGLADTVKDVDEDPAAGTGFVFSGTDDKSLYGALDRALQRYRDKQAWSSMTERIMQTDVAWRHSGAAYVELYNSVAVQ